jgi:cell division septal protein FtsQ
MLINIHERKESEFLRGEISIQPSRAKRNMKYILFSILLSIVVIIEIVLVLYGLGTKMGQMAGDSRWTVEIDGCSQWSTKVIEHDVMKYLEGHEFIVNVHSLGDYLRNKSIVSDVMIRKERQGKLLIHVTLRQPFAYMVSGRGYVVDENGILINEIDPNVDLQKFPLIFIDEKENNEQVIRKAVQVVKEVGRYDATYAHLKEVRYDGTEKVFLVIVDSGILKISEQGWESELWKYYAYKDHFKSMATARALFDLRFEGQIVMR